MCDNSWCFWSGTSSLRIKKTSLSLCPLEGILFNPPCVEAHCHFMSIYSFCSVCLFGVIFTGVTYLEHSLHVVYLAWDCV